MSIELTKKFKARDGSPRQQLLAIFEQVEFGMSYKDPSQQHDMKQNEKLISEIE